MAMRMNSGREKACPNQALYTFITFLLHVCVVWYGAEWCCVVWCVRERERERVSTPRGAFCILDTQGSSCRFIKTLRPK